MNTTSNTADGAGRVFEMRIELDAPIEQVWEAIATGEQLRRWFPIDARVTPGKGGSVWLSWGEGMEGEAAIEIWDAPHHLRTVDRRERPWSGGESLEAVPVEIAVDYFLEARKSGGTVLRLVHSGFGKGRGWDDDFDSISNGWKFELRSLRHYLTHHWGKARECVYVRSSADVPPEVAWARLMSPDGLVREGELSGLREGDAYRLVMSDGTVMTGKVMVCYPPRQFVGTVSELGDAIFRIEIERMGGGSGPFLWMSLWGEGRAEEWRERCRGVMEKLFGNVIVG